MEKMIVDGRVAILISPGYGAGWSTWDNPELAWDKRVVEYFLAHKDDKEFMHDVECEGTPAYINTRNFLKRCGYENVYLGGYPDIRVEWLPIGTKYVIREYDGSEYIQTEHEINWSVE